MTNGEKKIIWKKPLLNETAPASAIVSNDGKWVVTFDDWGSVGYGNIMVIYDDKGPFVKRYILEEISPFPINDYARSVSSRWWQSGARFINNYSVEIIFETQDKRKIKRILNLKTLSFEE